MFNQNLNPRSVTFNLILINVVFFFLSYVIGEKMVEYCALFYPASPYFKPLQLITHMFMHANMGHIFGNMFALFMFGYILERVWGPKRFLLFYFITGLGAAFLYMGVQALIIHNFTGSINPSVFQINEFYQVGQIYSTPVLGASGAVFGILVAFGMLFPNSEIMLLIFPIPIKAKYFVSLYFIYELYAGVANNPGDNVAHFAHVGGAVFGFIMVKLWNRNRDYLY